MLVCVEVCVCVHIPMRASYLSNIMFNYFKVTVLIETAYVFGGVCVVCVSGMCVWCVCV